jgi:hypothetical protein
MNPIQAQLDWLQTRLLVYKPDLHVEPDDIQELAGIVNNLCAIVAKLAARLEREK